MGPLWAGFAFDLYSTLAFWTGAAVQLIALIYSLRVLSKEIASFRLRKAQAAGLILNVEMEALAVPVKAEQGVQAAGGRQILRLQRLEA